MCLLYNVLRHIYNNVDSMHERTVVVLTTEVCTVLSVVMSMVTYTVESILTHIKT
mgnify:FL=1